MVYNSKGNKTIHENGRKIQIDKMIKVTLSVSMVGGTLPGKAPPESYTKKNDLPQQ